MTRDEHVRDELERLFRQWAMRAAPIGAVFFLLIAPLDLISVPELAPRFLAYRLVAAVGLLLVWSLAARVRSPLALRGAILLGVVLSAVAVEMMILAFGAFSPAYGDGMILLAVTALGLLPAGLVFHILVAVVVYAIYLVPLLLWGEVAHPRIFITQNYLFISILAVTIFMRQMHRRLLRNKIALAFDLADKEQEFEAQVSERTEKLVRAAAEWRATFDSVSDRILMIDADGTIVRMNSATREPAHRNFMDLIGTPISALLHSTGLEEALLPLATLRRTGARAASEIRHYLSGRWFIATAEPIPQGMARAGGVVLTLRDITDIKRMERAITEARDDWEETFDSIKEGITIHDANFRVLRANAAARRLLGREGALLEGSTCYALFHGLDAPIGGCPGCESLRSGEPTTVNFHEPHLGRHLEVTTLPRAGGGLTHVVHDISERKNAMDELSRAAERLQGILHRAPFGVFIVDDEFRVEFANPAMFAISGYPREQFVGALLGGFPGCVELGLAPLVRGALEGRPFQFGPALFHCREGKRVVGQFTGLPVTEEGQHKVLVFVEDLSSLTSAEEERRRLNELLLQSQKMESIGTLASGIAHDFNNILLAVIGMTDAAAERLEADHMARPELEAVIGAAERGSALVQQILAFSRKQELRVQPVDLPLLVEETRSMLVHVFPKKISITTPRAAAIPPVLGDATQLGQVLMNLAVNARDAMPDGGTLGIETGTARVHEDDPAHPGVAPGSYVLMRVSDTGLGMTPEICARIFDPFFTTKEPGRGTGLGLATAYGIVSQHGGMVRVQSAPGAGSTFFVYLPAAPDTVASQTRPASCGVETILLVEDDALARSVLSHKLAGLGYRMLEAGGGEQALRLLERENKRPDLLLCDLALGGVGAREVAAAARARASGVRVVFLSAHPESQLAQKGLLEPGDLVLLKSLGPEELARRLRAVLDSPAAGC